jgi:hypothetical protein
MSRFKSGKDADGNGSEGQTKGKIHSLLDRKPVPFLYNLRNISKKGNVYTTEQVRYCVPQFAVGTRLNSLWWDGQPKYCLNDGHEFSHEPIGIPLRYKASGGYYECEGYFCNYPCALRYDKDMHAGKHRTHILAMAKNEGYDVSHIAAAAPRQTLVRFGGFLPIEEYRTTNDTQKKFYADSTLPKQRVVDAVLQCDVVHQNKLSWQEEQGIWLRFREWNGQTDYNPYVAAPLARKKARVHEKHGLYNLMQTRPIAKKIAKKII